MSPWHRRKPHCRRAATTLAALVLAGIFFTLLASKPESAFADGNTITTIESGVGPLGQYSSIAIGTDGLPIISYYDSYNGALKAAHCSTPDCSAVDNISFLYSVGNAGAYTSIAIGSDGLPVISYYDVLGGDLRMGHCADIVCSSLDTNYAVDSAGDVGKYTSIAIGNDGLPVISYQDVSNGSLKAAHCGDLYCSSGNTVTTLSSTFGPLGEYTSIAIGTDGLPVISYWDSYSGALRAAHCGDAVCSYADSNAYLFSAGVTGAHTSIAIGSDGVPIISYYDVFPQDLRAGHCADTVCSSLDANPAPDTAGIVGEYTSVGIGADSLPIVSYYDASNGDLKVVHCGDIACSSGNILTVLDGAGDVGLFTSIAIGADGLPVMSYYDSTNGDLKVAHCSDVACTGAKPVGGFSIDLDGELNGSSTEAASGGAPASGVFAAVAAAVAVVGAVVVGGATWRRRRRPR